MNGLLLIALAFFSGTLAEAYPTFIGYGYKTCITCHYNPMGNGPLTDYGRAVSASAIAARPFFMGPYFTDEKAAEWSGFLGPVKLPSFIRPAAGYRGMFFNPSPAQGMALKNFNYITMQLDGNLTLRVLDDRIIAVLTGGYVPPPSTLPPSQQAGIPTVISREHYLGLRFSKGWGMYVGMMDIAYGIRIPDHIAYSRTNTFLAQNDQTHGILFHALYKHWQAAFHIILGNLFQSPALRLRGASMLVEFDTGAMARSGFSMMAVNSDFRQRRLASIHTRIGFNEGVSLLGELGYISNVQYFQGSTLNNYALMQSMIRMTRGLHLLMTMEYEGQPAFGSSNQTFRVGPSIQYFPTQRLELRVDAQGARTIGPIQINPNQISPDSFSLLGQIHLCL